MFGGFDYPHDLYHDLSERTVYIPSTSLCCCNQQRAITPSDHRVMVAEFLTKDSLLAVIQQILLGTSNIINFTSWHCGVCRQCCHRSLDTPHHGCSGKSSTVVSRQEKEHSHWRDMKSEDTCAVEGRDCGFIGGSGAHISSVRPSIKAEGDTGA
jgi:hypothetical protein